MAAQYQALCQKLRGHFAYYGITSNSGALSRFRWVVMRIWRKWLSRRRRKGPIPWDQFYRMLGRYPLPPPVAIHSTCCHVVYHAMTSRMRESASTDPREPQGSNPLGPPGPELIPRTDESIPEGRYGLDT